MEGNNQHPGFVMISRALFEHDFWKDQRQFSRAEAWIDLIRMAHYGTQPKRYIPKGQYINYITINRGELVASQRFLAERWSWSQKKVFTFMNFLVAREMVVVNNSKGVNHILLVNFEQYNTPTNQLLGDNHKNGIAQLEDNQAFAKATESARNQHGISEESAWNQGGIKIEERIKNNKKEEEREEEAAAVEIQNFQATDETEQQTPAGGRESSMGLAALAAKIGNQAQQIWIENKLETQFTTPAHAALCLDWLSHCKERQRPVTGLTQLRELLRTFNSHSLPDLTQVISYSVVGGHTNLYWDILAKNKKQTTTTATAAGWDSKITPDEWEKKVKYVSKTQLSWD